VTSRPGVPPRVGVLVIVTLSVLLPWSAPAVAGGSWLEADRYELAPGEQVTVTGEAYQGLYGWVEDGPFRLSLRPVGRERRWRDPADVVVGTLDLHSVTDVRVGVRATFTVPALPPGNYDLVYCDRACAGGLGDLVGLDRPFAVRPAVANGEDASDRTRSSLSASAVGLALVVVAVTAVAVRRRGAVG
jgi:hypothetical protein